MLSRRGEYHVQAACLMTHDASHDVCVVRAAQRENGRHPSRLGEIVQTSHEIFGGLSKK